jgi:hypothetical protein
MFASIMGMELNLIQQDPDLIFLSSVGIVFFREFLSETFNFLIKVLARVRNQSIASQEDL